MSNLVQSNAGRIAARIQSLGANFDPEILSLPGGSIIAVLIWAYASLAMVLGRDRTQEAGRNEQRIKPIAPCTDCLGHR